MHLPIVAVTLLLTPCLALSDQSHHYKRFNSTAGLNSTLTNSTALSAAERLIASAVAQQSEYNVYRLANPRRNQYRTAPVDDVQQHKRASVQPPRLDATLLAAAALLAERDAAQQAANGTLPSSLPPAVGNPHEKRAQTSSYWLPQVAGKSRPPMGWNSTYPVFRDVTKYGARGDGVTDDTAAINSAIADGGNCGANCLSSSIKGTLIYFPPGTYLISSPINAFYYSQLVGDALHPPTIRTSANFVGLGAIQTDVYYPEGKGSEWYINQSVFFRQVRNFIIDITATTTASVAGLHWQVAQATSLQNVAIYASNSTGDGNTQMGMFTENGSGGFMSDVTITGGAYGIYGGNQQYTVRNFIIAGAQKACIALIWDWGWTWSGLSLNNCPIGMSLINPQDPHGQVAGSTYIMDSGFYNVKTAIYAHFTSSTSLDSSIITLDNVAIRNVGTVLQTDTAGAQSVLPADINFVVFGNVELEGLQESARPAVRPPSLTTSKNHMFKDSFFARSKPQYESITTGNVLNVKDYGAKGDGTTDDTQVIQNILAYASTSNLIYFPAGSYIVTKTLFVYPHTRMTGSVWSQLVASGAYFNDQSHPKVLLQVGNAGDIGTVEISDMLLTSIGGLPGLVMMEWNVAASSQGSVGLWDTHFRVGGAYGTQMQVAQCPYKGNVKYPDCLGANLMLHITPTANAYMENVWAWNADHDLDDPSNAMVSIEVGRGMLIESAGPTWLYGTSSEHSMLYQYNFANSRNTWAGMIQTESPYFQNTASGSGRSPALLAYSIGQYAGDPVFGDGTCTGSVDACDVSWGVMMQNTTNLTIAGAGLYSWFGNYAQDCVDAQNCQQRMVFDDGKSSNLAVWNLVTIGSTEMISSPALNLAVYAKNFTQSIGHPYWSAIAGYMDTAAEAFWSCEDNDTRIGCLEHSTCDLTRRFANFADLQAAHTPDVCNDYHAMDTLATIINGTMRNYTDANNNYDQAWGWYVEYMGEFIPDAIDLFMSTPDKATGKDGQQYFECSCVSGDCQAPGIPQVQQCPYTYKQLAGADDYTISYRLTNSSGFYNGIFNAYGINETWIKFDTSEQKTSPASGCGSSHTNLVDCIKTDHKFLKYPQKSDHVVIDNPKDIVTKVAPNMGVLQNSILATSINMNIGAYNESTDDALQVYSMPVFMLDQSVQSMQKAKQMGEQHEKQKKLELALNILSGVLALVPFLDDFTPELVLGLRLATTVSILAQTAITIESVVEDPTQGPLLFLGMVNPELRIPGRMNTAAVARRGLDSGQLDKIGDKFKQSEADFQKATKRKCTL